MRAANPDELTEHALPIMTATISEAELVRWLPFSFQEITDPWADAEPSKGALIKLDNGDYFVAYWGHDSGQLTIRVSPTTDASAFVTSFFREVPLPRARVTWLRKGIELPMPLHAVAALR